MGLLTILRKVKVEEKEIRLLILGLDNAGKTSITKHFLGQPVDNVEPTLGFSIQTLDYQLGGNVSDCEFECSTSTNANVNEPRSLSEGSSNWRTTTSSTQDQQQCYQLHLWDIGGQSSIRAYWRNYFEKTDGLIFVIDSSDKHRMQLVEQELSTLLQQERLQGATLLVLANKQDLKNALTSEDIATELELHSKIQYQNRHWAIHGCSAMTGQGLREALEWLVHDITNRIFMF
jgi:ADP-ribosylation factor-like protein 2